MAKEPRQPKSESLTIRLDPKTRFILDFMSRANGQTITTVVERAILEAANNVTINEGYTTWKNIWSISEGVRALRIAGQADLLPSFKEEEMLGFVDRHVPFFFEDRERGKFDEAYIEIIWPKIDVYLDYWNSRRSVDYFGAGKLMAQAIKGAGVEPPVWPPRAPNQIAGSGRMNEIVDDDIPF